MRMGSYINTRGFTLLELLVVLVISAYWPPMSALVTLGSWSRPSPRPPSLNWWCVMPQPFPHSVGRDLRTHMAHSVLVPEFSVLSRIPYLNAQHSEFPQILKVSVALGFAL
ncbi:MAG: prepilin-type N-terminal cleavage/methylation domain-containing protein [Limnobacter sp.]|uniref:prepilin-type N-terminal cleavage/methylation domain-containing protein n=1 Tax=Limnobacter sp. TaxID=2003368 RepID=UPI00391AD6A7